MINRFSLYKKTCVWLAVGAAVCVLAAVFVLANRKGENDPRELIKSGVYVGADCLYMNPLSSYISLGDSGFRYEVTGDSFIITKKISGGSVEIMPVEWGWREFPYTEEEWRGMYSPPGGGERGISKLHGEILYQTLSERYFLIKADGELLLVELGENIQMGEFIWSIYKLVPESALKTAAE